MLTNNDILKKLRVALELRDDQLVEILKLELIYYSSLISIHLLLFFCVNY